MPTTAQNSRTAALAIARTTTASLKVGDFVQVTFPALNKNCTLSENDKEIAAKPRISKCKVRKIIKVCAAVYTALGKSLMDDNDSLWEKIGGAEADMLVDGKEPTFEQLCSNDKLMAQFRATCWTNVVIVTDGKRTFVVNTEGYEYARYVGRLAV